MIVANKQSIAFSGVHRFAYNANDGRLDGNVVTATITVNP